MFALNLPLATLKCELVGADRGVLEVDLLVRQLLDVELLALVSGRIFKLLSESVVAGLLVVIALFQWHARLYLGKIESVWQKLAGYLRKALWI